MDSTGPVLLLGQVPWREGPRCGRLEVIAASNLVTAVHGGMAFQISRGPTLVEVYSTAGGRGGGKRLHRFGGEEGRVVALGHLMRGVVGEAQI